MSVKVNELEPAMAKRQLLEEIRLLEVDVMLNTLGICKTRAEDITLLVDYLINLEKQHAR